MGAQRLSAWLIGSLTGSTIPTQVATVCSTPVGVVDRFTRSATDAASYLLRCSTPACAQRPNCTPSSREDYRGCPVLRTSLTSTQAHDRPNSKVGKRQCHSMLTILR